MKILYNVTLKVDLTVHEEWLSWMISEHIPDVMATKMFESYKLCKILSQDESEGVSYSIQYICPDMKTLHQYTIKHSPELQKTHAERYKGKYVSFRTLLEVVSE